MQLNDPANDKPCPNCQRALVFVTNHIEDVHNQIGGVIGYKLNLNKEETEQLFRIIEGKPCN